MLRSNHDSRSLLVLVGLCKPPLQMHAFIDISRTFLAFNTLETIISNLACRLESWQCLAELHRENAERLSGPR